MIIYNEYKKLSSAGASFMKEVLDLAKRSGVERLRYKKFQKIPFIIAIDVTKAKVVGFINYRSDVEAKEFHLLQMAVCPSYRKRKVGKTLLRKAMSRNVNKYMGFCSIKQGNTIALNIVKGLKFVIYEDSNGFTKLYKGSSKYKDKAFTVIDTKRMLTLCKTNVWRADGGKWQETKKDFLATIDRDGEAMGVDNPNFATREGCLPSVGDKGNASILDPVVCNILLRLFLPIRGRVVYNPFAGGVQMGFMAARAGCKYYATEIRKTQADANNLICTPINKHESTGRAKWIHADSTKFYHEDIKADFGFTCPTYPFVEDYKDNGKDVEGDLSNIKDYKIFLERTLKGLLMSYNMLKENRFMAIMIGDGRDKKTGAYYGVEEDIVVYLRSIGMKLYNKITYCEPVFMSGLSAPKLLKKRKLPKAEQRIIIMYKGDTSKIPTSFANLGI